MRAPLHVYPGRTVRTGLLGVVLLVTVAQYYEVYLHGAVSTILIDDFDMSLSFYVSISIASSVVSGLASVGAGLGDRYGRVNLTLAGLLVSSVLVAVVIPQAGSRTEFLVLTVVTSAVEGAVLVYTPALVRDFSPRMSRGTAMSIWLLGPVLGNLASSGIASLTLDSHPDWQFQYRVCGAIGLVVTVVGALTLRELAPELRNRVIDGTTGAGPTLGPDAPGASMLTPRIVVPAVAFAFYLFFYLTRVGFFVVYFVTSFGYNAARANALDNWSWIFNMVGLLAFGALGDRIGARKPLVVLGSLVLLAGIVMWSVFATRPDTSYSTWVLLLAVCALGGGMASANWLAAFSEAVELRNPARVASGLAVWGWSIRVIGAVALVSVLVLVPAAGTLVDHGPEVQRIATANAAELATLRAISPEAKAALLADPDDPAAQQAAIGDIVRATGLGRAEAVAAFRATAAVDPGDLSYLSEHGAEVRAAATDGPGEWQRWWLLCGLGQLVLLATVWMLPGPWRPTLRRPTETAVAPEDERDAVAA